MCCSESGPKIWLILLVVGSFLFFLIQLLSGNISGCIALQAYSYHVLSDALSLFVGLISFLAHHNSSSSSKSGENEEEEEGVDVKSSVTNTYGWVRVELVGSLISHVAVISLCFSCGLHSLEHLVKPDESLFDHRRTMLTMGGLGIIVHLSVIFYSLLVRCCARRRSGGRTLSATPSRVLVSSPVSPSTSTVTKWDAFSAHTPIPSSGFNAFCLPFLHQCCHRRNASDHHSYVGVNGRSKSGSLSSQVHNGVMLNGDGSRPMVTSVSRYPMRPQTLPNRTKQSNNNDKIDYWSMLLHMGLGLLASILIVIDALVHYFIDYRDHVWIHYLDPALALIILGIVVATVIPNITLAALTLIQHIPEHIDIVSLQNELMKSVPQIRHIHDLHVWRLEGKKIMGTIHIVFEGINDEKHFTKISKKIMEIFHRKQIHSLTFQPEFKTPRLRSRSRSPSSSSSCSSSAAVVPAASTTATDATTAATTTSLAANTAANSASPSARSRPRVPRSETVLSTDCLYECSSPQCAADTCCGSNADRRLARETGSGSTPRHRPQTERVKQRSTRNLFQENNDDEVLEDLINQRSDEDDLKRKADWRRLHRNQRWSSSAGFLTPSTSKQRVNTVSSSGDIEMDLMPDRSETRSRHKTKSTSSDGGRAGERVSGDNQEPTRQPPREAKSIGDDDNIDNNKVPIVDDNDDDDDDDRSSAVETKNNDNKVESMIGGDSLNDVQLIIESADRRNDSTKDPTSLNGQSQLGV